MAKNTAKSLPRIDEHSVPHFWPLAAAFAMGEAELALFKKNLKFLAEAEKVDHHLKPQFATANTVMLDLHTLRLREFGDAKSGAVPTLVDAPYAGHTATIADYHKGQSLVETLLANGHRRVLVTDWKSAGPDMRDYDIDNYLAEINVCVDDLGARVNLIGLCQGGLMALFLIEGFSALFAALEFRRHLKNGGWLLFSGLIDFVLVFLIWQSWPATASWAIGLLTGVNLFFLGLSLGMLALAAHGNDSQPSTVRLPS